MSRAYVFPGQGSQAVGMGRELAEAFATARQVFEEVNDALSQKLSVLMFEGPEADLMLTENAPPALMAASLGVVRVVEEDFGVDPAARGQYAAGHYPVRSAEARVGKRVGRTVCSWGWTDP